MGAVDLVVQVESPGSVARGLQRIGRAGHQVGEPSRGKIFPKYRGDLLEAAVVVQRMRDGLVEEMRYPRNPLDVLAQQIVAMCAVDEWSVDDLHGRSSGERRTSPSSRDDVVREACSTCSSGRYPSDEFAGLRPADRVGPHRTTWCGLARAPRRIAVASGGTIPDRGLFGVFLPDGDARRRARRGDGVREPHRRGLRARRVDVAHRGDHARPRDRHAGARRAREDAVLEGRQARPAARARPGASARSPASLRGRTTGARRPALARRSTRSTSSRRGTSSRTSTSRPRRPARSPTTARSSSSASPTRSATGASASSRRSASRVHAPWALAIEERLERGLDLAVQVLWSDDGIVIRLPESVDDDPARAILLSDPDEVEELVVERAAGHVAVRVGVPRERGARAPAAPAPAGRAHAAVAAAPARRRPARRWRARLPDVPDAARDHARMPARRVRPPGAARGARATSGRGASASSPSRRRRVAVRAVAAVRVDRGLHVRGRRSARRAPRHRPRARPRSAPRAARGRGAARAPRSRARSPSSSSSCKRLAETRRARSADDLHDLLRRRRRPRRATRSRRSDRRAIRRRWVDALVASGARSGPRRGRRAGRGRRGRGAAPRRARRRDPARAARRLHRTRRRSRSTISSPATRARTARSPSTRPPAGSASPSIGCATRSDALQETAASSYGEFRPGGVEREWCDDGRAARAASPLARRAAREVEPVDPETFGALPRRRGTASVRPRAAPTRSSTPSSSSRARRSRRRSLETRRAARAGRRTTGRPMLDELCAAGELVWVGAGPLGADDGRVRLCFRDRVRLLAPARRGSSAPSATAARRDPRPPRASAARRSGPSCSRAAGIADERCVLNALWDLVWAGEVTNDTFGPLRAAARGRKPRSTSARAAHPDRSLARLGPPAGAGPLVARRPAARARSRRRPRPSHARAVQLLERHGVVTREAVLAEGVARRVRGRLPGAAGARGSRAVRRGCFVDGLGAAQFALPGAVERLRDLSRSRTGRPRRPSCSRPPIRRSRTAPRCPGPRARAARRARPVRTWSSSPASPAAYLERGARTLLTFDGSEVELWVDAVVSLVKDGRLRSLQLQRIDDGPVPPPRLADALRAAGFVDGYRGLTLRS